MLSRMLSSPRHEEARCPACGEAPFRGPIWVCENCRTRFDAFDHPAACPGCGNASPTTMCPSCHQRSPMARWFDTTPTRCRRARGYQGIVSTGNTGNLLFSRAGSVKVGQPT